MTKTLAPPKNNRFRSAPMRNKPERFDREDKAIFGAKIIQKGRLNDYDVRPWTVDDTTLQQVADFGNQANNGLKARFSHPNLSDDGMGKHLGTWRNFRIEGDAVFADLHFSDAAYNTPHGDLAGHVLDLAEESPEKFGVSVATKLDEDVMFDNRGPIRDAPMRFTGLHAADVVDEPAATRGGLFDDAGLPDLATVGTWCLNNYFAESDPKDVMIRFGKLVSKHFGVGEHDLLSTFAPAATAPPADPPVDPNVLSRQEAKRFTESFGEKGATWYIEGKTFDECSALQRKDFEKQVSDLRHENEDLQTQLSAAKSQLGHDPGDPLSADPTGKPETKLQKRAKECSSESGREMAGSLQARWEEAGIK